MHAPDGMRCSQNTNARFGINLLCKCGRSEFVTNASLTNEYATAAWHMAHGTHEQANE